MFMMVQCGVEVGRAVTSLQLKAWRTGISVTLRNRMVQGFHRAQYVLTACHWGVCVSVFTLSALYLPCHSYL